MASPDGAVLRAAECCLAELGLTPLIARSVAEAQHALVRVSVELVCLDSLLAHDELDGLWRWLSSDPSRPMPALIILAPPSARSASSVLPPFFRPRRDGLVSKPLAGGELEREVARLLAARPHAPEVTLLRAGGIALDTERRALLFADGGTLALTPTEFRLMRCLMDARGAFVSAEELVEQVWNYPAGTGGPELVRAHVSNLRRKLRCAGQDPHLLRTLPYQGYSVMTADSERRR